MPPGTEGAHTQKVIFRWAPHPRKPSSIQSDANEIEVGSRTPTVPEPARPKSTHTDSTDAPPLISHGPTFTKGSRLFHVFFLSSAHLPNIGVMDVGWCRMGRGHERGAATHRRPPRRPSRDPPFPTMQQCLAAFRKPQLWRT
jgi:hypothetical protein